MEIWLHGLLLELDRCETLLGVREKFPGALRKDIRKIVDFGDATSCFSMVTQTKNLWHSLRRSLLSFDVRNDATTETKFIAVDYKSLTTGKVEMDRFFGTKDISTIEI